MDELRQVLEEILNEKLKGIVLSNSRDASQASKARIRPLSIGGELKFQETRYQGTKVFHENYEKEQMILQITKELQTLFRQCEITGGDRTALILVSKKGKMTIKVKKNAESGGAAPDNAVRDHETDKGKENPAEGLAHNRVKQYILPEGAPVDFLIRLGVQTPDGRITRNRYDKFRQINRYLEFIRDVLGELPRDRTLHIVDFGCGKSYLTFAMYYFLHVKEGRDIKVTGLDLKEDVILHCNALARELGYDGLHFEQGDIKNYEGENHVDMVVSLHACDLATDYALEKAVKWGATVILAVPCCQHELNGQMRNELLRPVLKYGIIRERMAALITDALRAQLLEENGYNTQILEFIDMEHTPKNLLIRAVRQRGMGVAKKGTARRELEQFLEISPTLERLLATEPRGAFKAWEEDEE